MDKNESRITRIDKCLSALTHEFMKVARVEDNVEGFFTAKNELHLILADMAKEDIRDKLLAACLDTLTRLEWWSKDKENRSLDDGFHVLRMAISMAEGREP